MNITLYSPHPKQLEVHADPARFKVLNWGRRTGKSTLAQNYLICPGIPTQMKDWPIKGALQEVGRYWIVAPTYTQAKSVYWRGLMFSKDPGNTTAIPRELIAKTNETELIIHLINGSTIELKGADNPDSLRGAGIKGVVMDEYASTDPTAWEYVIQPALSDSNGWAVFISTPNGKNHFFELAERAKYLPDWSYHHATIEDNPNITLEEKQRLKGELDEDTFAQEFMAEFRKRKGLVYPEFNPDIHTFDPMEPERTIPGGIPVGGLWGMGIDPGTSGAFAAVFFFIDNDDNWYLMDELYERFTDTDKLARMLQRKMAGNYFSYKVADQAAAQFILDMNSMYKMGVNGQKKTRDSIPEGIRLCRQKLFIQEGTGRPKLFVSNRCRNFLNEIEGYRYPDKREGRNEAEDPVKENDHLMDAWRYLQLALYLPPSPEKPQKVKVYSEVTGRVIGYETDRGTRVPGFSADEGWL